MGSFLISKMTPTLPSWWLLFVHATIDPAFIYILKEFVALFWTTKLLVLHLWNGSNSQVEQSLYLLQGTALFSACYIPCSLYYQIWASCQWQFFQAPLFYSSELLVPSILRSVSSCVKVFISSPVQLNRFWKWIQQTQMTNLPLLCLVFLFIKYQSWSLSNFLGKLLLVA